MTGDYDFLLRLMMERRSIRGFRSDPVSTALVDAVLEAARWAPSAGNRQALRFIVVSRSETILAMGEAVRASSSLFVETLRPSMREQAASYTENFLHFACAPVVICVTYRSGGGPLTETSACSGPARQSSLASVSAVSSAAAAVMNLILAAHALKLGACWMTGPLVAASTLKELIRVPKLWEVAALVPIGYPIDEQIEPPPRRPLGKLVQRVE